MAAFVVVLLGLLGFTIGYAVSGTPAGGVAATALALALGAVLGRRRPTSAATSSS